MVFDVAIIGAGVTGLAIARRFAAEGAKICVLERGSDILSGASKANSAILHTGFDAPPNSLELALVQEGHAEFSKIADDAGFALLPTGAILVAWNDLEAQALTAILTIAHANGVTDCVSLNEQEARALEPGLAGNFFGAIHVPREGLIDPWTPFLSYGLQVLALGGNIVTGAELLAASRKADHWQMSTTKGDFAAGLVINCAGAQGDHVNMLLLDEPVFTVKPRKGQFLVFDKASDALVNGIILPVPNERTKGVVVTRTVFGNVLVGPTAEEQDERDRPATTNDALKGLMEDAIRIIPGLQDIPVTATYAGIRPATDKKEYRISHHPDRGVIVVGGIRSTGLTASLGIANHVWRLHSGHQQLAPIDLSWPKVAMLSDHAHRDWTEPGYGEIVCHCEMVTDREIRAALNGPLPARDPGGLKRRTRAGMGRCQGFHCLSKLMNIAGPSCFPPVETKP